MINAPNMYCAFPAEGGGAGNASSQKTVNFVESQVKILGQLPIIRRLFIAIRSALCCTKDKRLLMRAYIHISLLASKYAFN